MYTQPRIIRCRKCKRLFSDYADHCPECETKTPRGWFSAVLPTVCVLLALAVIAWTIHFLSNRPGP